MIPREVLGVTGEASATAGEQGPVMTRAGTAGVNGRGASGPVPSSGPQISPNFPTPDGTTAGPAAVSATAQFDVVAETISYRDQFGTVYRPDVSAAHPVVYFLHGGFWEGGNRQQYRSEATMWARMGWVAVTLDYQVETDVATMLEDVWAGIGFVEQQWYADATRQILFGDSAGGHLAALTAVEHPDHFVGQILWSPVISPANAYRDGRKKGGASGHLGASALLAAGEDWPDTDPSRMVTPQTPPLWIAGSTKEFVPFKRQGKLLADAMGRSRVEQYVVKGSTHGKNLQHGRLLRSARAWAREQVSAL